MNNLNLKNKNNNEIKINSLDEIDKFILILKKITKKNPTKNALEKLKSLLSSETFYSLFVEGEISSRKQIKKIFSDKKINEKERDEMIKNFKDAYLFILKKPDFSISNFFTLYNLLSKNTISKERSLRDGLMYRDDKVYIGSNNLKFAFEGFDHKNIKCGFEQLINFLSNDIYDLYLRSIVGHIYFEIIHPYFDYNGRTGRFIPMWLFTLNERVEEMMYFATAVGNYRETYLSIFKKNIDPRTYEINIDRMIIEILKLLIKNQYQYIFLKELENKYQEKNNKKLTNLQKDFIWFLMKKCETSNSETSWFKINKKDKDYIEKEWRNASFSNDTINLEKAGLVKISNDKPRRYKLNNYKLINYLKI